MWNRTVKNKKDNKTKGMPHVNIYTRRIVGVFWWRAGRCCVISITDNTEFLKKRIPCFIWSHSFCLTSLQQELEVESSRHNHEIMNLDTRIQELNLLLGWGLFGCWFEMTGLSQTQDSANLSTNKQGTADTKSGNSSRMAKIKDGTEMEFDPERFVKLYTCKKKGLKRTASSDLRLLGSPCTWVRRKALKQKRQKTQQVIMTRSFSPLVLTDGDEDKRDGCGISEGPSLLCAGVHGEGGGLWGGLAAAVFSV